MVGERKGRKFLEELRKELKSIRSPLPVIEKFFLGFGKSYRGEKNIFWIREFFIFVFLLCFALFLAAAPRPIPLPPPSPEIGIISGPKNKKAILSRSERISPPWTINCPPNIFEANVAPFLREIGAFCGYFCIVWFGYWCFGGHFWGKIDLKIGWEKFFEIFNGWFLLFQ